MRRRQFISASGIVFAAIFLISAVLGDGILSKGTVTKAAAKQAGEPNVLLPLTETIVTEPVLLLLEQVESDKIEAIEAESDGEEEFLALKEIAPVELAENRNTESNQAKAAQEAKNAEPEKAEPAGQASTQDKETQEEAKATGGKTTEAKPEEVKTAETEKKADSAETKDDASDGDTSKASQKKAKKAIIDYAIADVDTSLNIRKKPSTEAEIVGKLYRGAKATIVKRGKKWTKIESGTVKGYVANDYLMFDEEAEKGAEKFGTKIATVQTETLRIRKEPGTDAPVLDLAAEGERLLMADTSSKKAKKAAKDGWIAIAYSEEETGYVSAEYVSITIELEEAISIEEEQRILEEKRREEEAAQAAKNGGNTNAGGNTANAGKGSAVVATARGGVSVSADDAYLMAVIVYMEAGNQSYEGKLAVANVIVNRLLSGIWGNSVSSVIYAPGQFYSPSSATLQRYLKQGPTSSCVNAVSDALAGNNNIGDYMFFCTTWAANYSSYSRYTVIGDHCFYQR